MKKICVLLLLLPVYLALPAQTETIIEQAKDRMKRFDYPAAVKLLEKDAAKKNVKAEVLEILGDCYRLMDNKDKALSTYQKAVNMEGVSPEVYRHIGSILLSDGKYEEAKALLLAYTDTLNGLTDVSLLLATCDTAMTWIARKDSSVFNVSQVPRINGRYSDWGAVLYKGNLLFISNRPSKRQNNTSYNTLYQARAAKGNPGMFNSAGVLYSNLTDHHIGPICFSNDQKTVFYTQTNTNLSFRKQTEHGKVWEYSLEIMTAKMGANKLTDIKPFNYNNPRKYSVGHPALSPDNNVLYFASDMPGGQGGVDLYFCRRNTGGWSEPENCGPMINTAGNEMFPTVDSTGVLYFSSNGRVGLGGLDVYRAKGKEDNWTAVENMRYPLNSSGDDFYLMFSPDRQSGYFSSNRPTETRGMGSDDVYEFTLRGLLPDFGYINNPKKYEQKLSVQFRGTVTAQQSGQPIEGVTISLIDNTNQTQNICNSDSTGKFTMTIYSDRSYTYSCIRDGYVPIINQTLTKDSLQIIDKDIHIVMQEVKAKEENVIADNVFLDTGEGSGVEYSVQVMASKEYPDWRYLDKIREVYPQLKIYYGSFPDAFTRFTVGRFPTIKEATRLKNDLRTIGYSDAFVVMFIDGVRKVVSYN